MTNDSKVRENRLRRMADRQGLTLTKSRRRDPRALDYGKWTITSQTEPGWQVAELVGHEHGLTLDELEAQLLIDDVSA